MAINMTEDMVDLLKDNKGHKCDKCGMAYDFKPSLNQHLIRKHNLCSECGEVFPSLAACKKHILTHMHCSICKRQLKTMASFKIHMSTHSLGPRDKSYLCSYCGDTYGSHDTLRKHVLLTHTREPFPFQCSVCSKGFLRAYALRNHFMIHTRQKPHKCPMCRKRFRSLSYARKHMEVHTGRKPHKCQRCKRKFCLPSGLTLHLNCYAQCSLYNQRFNQLHSSNTAAATSATAVNTTENQQTDSYKCKFCSREFSAACDLQEHMTTHRRANFQQCVECHRSFPPSMLKHHMLQHAALKPHQCRVCNQRFATHHSLRVHMKIHSTTEPSGTVQPGGLNPSTLIKRKKHIHRLPKRNSQNAYKCYICNKSFPSPAAFKVHVKIHSSAGRPFCHLCREYFTQTSDLKEHLLKNHQNRTQDVSHNNIHRDKVKTYKCGYCDLKFIKLSTMKHHMIRLHVRKTPLVCPQCVKQFVSQSEFVQHVTAHIM